jgi:hypothetical protein
MPIYRRIACLANCGINSIEGEDNYESAALPTELGWLINQSLAENEAEGLIRDTPETLHTRTSLSKGRLTRNRALS